MIAVTLDDIAWRITRANEDGDAGALPRLIAWGDYLSGFAQPSRPTVTDQIPTPARPRTIVQRYETPQWLHPGDPDPHRLRTTGPWNDRKPRIDWHRDRVRTEASTVALILSERLDAGLPLTDAERSALLSGAGDRIDRHLAVASYCRETAPITSSGR